MEIYGGRSGRWEERVSGLHHVLNREADTLFFNSWVTNLRNSPWPVLSELVILLGISDITQILLLNYFCSLKNSKLQLWLFFIFNQLIPLFFVLAPIHSKSQTTIHS